MVKDIEVVLCFAILAKIGKFKRATIFKKYIVHCLDTLGVKNFDEIALAPMVKELEAMFGFHRPFKWLSLAYL